MFFSCSSQTPVTGISYDDAGYMSSNSLGTIPIGDVIITSCTMKGFFVVIIFSLKSLCDFENEYGFVAEQGKRSSIFAEFGFLYLLIILSWNRFISGLISDSIEVAIKILFL